MIKTKQISEGAMMIALISLLLIINRQMANVLENIIAWVIALPMLVYCVRYSWRASLLVFVSCLLMSLILAAPTTIFYLFSALSTGLIYGYGVRKGWQNRVLLLLSVGMQMITMLLTVLVLSSIFGYNINEEFLTLFNLIQSVEGIGDSQSIVWLFLGVIYIGSSLLQGILIHVLAHMLLARLRIKARPLKQIWELVYPKWVGVFVVISWLAYMGSSLGLFSTNIRSYILMVYVIGSMIGISSGLLVILTYAIKEQKKSLLMVACIIGFIPGVNNLVLWLGIYNIFSGFHQKIGNR